MKQTKKAVSLLLTVVFLAISVCLPLGVGAAEDYTIEKEGTLTRFVPTTTSFAENETKTFDFTVDTTADYALFMSAGTTDKTNTVTTFEIKEKNSETKATFTYRNGTGDSYAYTHTGYRYERVGNIAEVRVALTANTEYTLSVKREAALADFQYIDLRCLTLPITGGKQAVASADFTSFSTTTAAHVNEQLNYNTVALPEGYKLIGDYVASDEITSKITGPRYIHITGGSYATYTLDVQKAGYYRLTYKTRTWKDNKVTKAGDSFSFNIPFVVDGETKDTLVWSQTLTSAGQELNALDLKAVPVYFSQGTHTVKLGPATDGSYAYHILLEELEDYDPNSHTLHTMDTQPKKIDDVLSRFELSETIGVSEANSYAFSFTPSADGEYAFFMKHAKGTHSLTVTAADSDENKVFEATYTTSGHEYERFGNQTYQAAPLEKGKTYTITLSSSDKADASMKISYFDVRCVNAIPVPAEGKFAISPSDYMLTNIDSVHANQQYDTGCAANADYPMVGNYFSSDLQEPRSQTTGLAHSDGKYITYALNVTTPGYFTLTLPNVTTYWGGPTSSNGNALAEDIRLSVNGQDWDTQGWRNTPTDLTFKRFYLNRGVNLIQLTNLTTPFDYEVTENDEPTTKHCDGKGICSYLKMLMFSQEAAEPEPTTVSGTTKTDSVIPVNSFTDTAGTVTYDTTNGCYNFKNGASVTYKVNVETKGTYAVYVDAQAALRGVDVFVNNVNKTGAMYENNFAQGVRDGNNRQVKKLSFPMELEPGEYTIQLAFKNGLKYVNNAVEEITDEDDYTSRLYSVWVRRTDLTASAEEEMFLRSWDFASVSFVNEEEGTASGGWCFPHQYGQGGPCTVGSFTDCRSVVFINGVSVTYKVNIPQDGLYYFSIFSGGSTGDNTYTMTIGEKAYPCTMGICESAPMKSASGPVFVSAGTYDVRFTAPASPNGTLRLYGMSVAKQAGDFVAVGEDVASVGVSLGESCTGTVITAFYGASKELVGIKTESITEATSYSTNVVLSDTAVEAKVLVWSDLTNAVPQREAIRFTSESENWHKQ